MDDLISKLSEIRSDYNCFSADEEPYYRALSEAIKILSQLADGDTISRRAAIDAMKDALDPHIVQFVKAKMAIEALPPVAPSTARTTETTAETTAPSTDDWIPCSERMPEEGQKCLVYDKAVGFRVDTYIGHGNPFNWELFVRDYEAWMPLPASYKGE